MQNAQRMLVLWNYLELQLVIGLYRQRELDSCTNVRHTLGKLQQQQQQFVLQNVAKLNDALRWATRNRIDRKRWKRQEHWLMYIYLGIGIDICFVFNLFSHRMDSDRDGNLKANCLIRSKSCCVRYERIQSIWIGRWMNSMGKPLAPRNRNKMFHSNCLRCFDVTEYGEYSKWFACDGDFLGSLQMNVPHRRSRYAWAPWVRVCCVCVWYRSSDVMQMIHMRTKSLSKMKLEFFNQPFAHTAMHRDHVCSVSEHHHHHLHSQHDFPSLQMHRDVEDTFIIIFHQCQTITRAQWLLSQTKEKTRTKNKNLFQNKITL